MNTKKINLGDEFDADLLKRLVEALKKLGGATRHLEKGIAGSQELNVWKLNVLGHEITVERETYIGLSIFGLSEIVDKIAEELVK
jgi:hypothetical protein